MTQNDPRVITLDIETTTATPGRVDPKDMDLAIICIHDSKTDTFDSFLQEDLNRLWPILENADALVGYNSDHFDIPILNKYYPGDLAAIKSIDILNSVRESLGRRIKLDAIAKATLGTKKIGSGLDAIEWWKEGKIDKVREYCIEDVRITRKVYDYALEHGKLLYMDFGDKKTIPIDTESWQRTEKSAMNHTLPF